MIKIDIKKFSDSNKVKEQIKKINCDLEVIDYMAKKGIFYHIKIYSVKTFIANIIKQEMLSNCAEAVVSKNTINCKDKETDVLIFCTLNQMQKALVTFEKMKISQLNEIVEKIKKNI